MVFRVISLDEIIKDMSADREKKKINNQVLGRTNIKTTRRTA